MLLNDVRPHARKREEQAAQSIGQEPGDTLVERHGYRAPESARWLGLGGTSLIAACVTAAFLITMSATFAPPPPQATLTVFDIAPPALDPETPPEQKVAPEPARKKEIAAATPPEPVAAKVPVLPEPAPEKISLPKVVQSVAQPETAAPKTLPTPPAPQMANNGVDSWEGRVLSRLEQFRRYPSGARSARQQGVVYIRFRIDRNGRVMSSSLARSSGHPALDRAAMETLRRADPLPKIPADRPDEIELSVPVEFYIR